MASSNPSLPPVHVPPDGGETVFLVGDTYTTLLSGAQTGGSFTLLGRGLARMLFMYSPAGMDGMFAEIGTPGTRGAQAPPRTIADIEAMIAVAARYRFAIEG